MFVICTNPKTSPVLSNFFCLISITNLTSGIGVNFMASEALTSNLSDAAFSSRARKSCKGIIYKYSVKS